MDASSLETSTYAEGSQSPCSTDAFSSTTCALPVNPLILSKGSSPTAAQIFCCKTWRSFEEKAASEATPTTTPAPKSSAFKPKGDACAYANSQPSAEEKKSTGHYALTSTSKAPSKSSPSKAPRLSTTFKSNADNSAAPSWRGIPRAEKSVEPA